MLTKFINHFRLTWRLFRDKRINFLIKLFLIGIPIVYLIIPLSDDYHPFVGLLDDIIFLFIATFIFNALCPRDIVHEHKMAIKGQHISPEMTELEKYRNPSEARDLAISFIAITILVDSGGEYAGLAMLLIFIIGYIETIIYKWWLVINTIEVSEKQLPHLQQALNQAQALLPPTKVRLLVKQDIVMSAYTFGYREPYTIVLHSALVESLSPEEIQAVIGHELGHILLNHVQLTSIISVNKGLGRLLFYKWSRSCEYSCDAVAYLASKRKEAPVISSLLKLVSGLKDEINLNEFLNQIDKPTELVSNILEIDKTHPGMRNRIKQLIKLSKSI